MKSIKQCLFENLYGNLGIDTDQFVKDWAGLYNKLHPQTPVVIKDNKIYGAIPGDPLKRTNKLELLIIDSADLLDDGHLPDYINIVAKDGLSVYVETPKFKSFKNFPKVEHMYLETEYPISDINNIDCCNYISIIVGAQAQHLTLRNLKPKIIELADKEMNKYDFGDVLKNIKGCSFSNYASRADSGKGTAETQITVCNISSKTGSKILSDFFKNNRFGMYLALDIWSPLESLEFLNSTTAIFRIPSFSLRLPDDFGDYNRDSYVRPLLNIADKLFHVRLAGGGRVGVAFVDELNRNKNKISKKSIVFSYMYDGGQMR